MGRLRQRIASSPTLARAVAAQRGGDVPPSSLAADEPGQAGSEGFAHRVVTWPLGADHEGARPGTHSGAAPGPVLGVEMPDDLPTLPALRQALALLGGADKLAQSGPVVCLDTETTGPEGDLAGLRAAVPFLVGFAVCGVEQIRVEQFTLQTPGAERSMLRACLETLERALGGGGTLVTYNGASFDVPLMLRRAERLGIDARTLSSRRRHHVDLLHPARRLWRDRFEDCRLTTLERRVLGASRVGDVPGHEIPEVFWAMLRRPDDPAVMAQVARVRAHNELDLLSLPRLAVASAAQLTAPSTFDDRLRAGAHFEKTGDWPRAVAALRAALASASTSPTRGPVHALRRVEAGLDCARLLRRLGRRDEQLALLRELCASHPGDPASHEALAKELEHRERDPAAALAVLTRSRAPCPHRVARLQGKLARAGAPGVDMR